METEAIVQQTLLDYGTIGALLLMIIYFAWYQYQREQKNTEEIKKDLKLTNEKLFDLTVRQIKIQEQQSDLLAQLNRKIDDLPNKFKNLKQ